MVCYITFIYTEGRYPYPTSWPYTMAGKLIQANIWSAVEDPNRFRQLKPRGKLEDYGIYTDALTSWGLGMREKFAAFQLKKAEISAGETIAVVYYLDVMGFHDICLHEIR